MFLTRVGRSALKKQPLTGNALGKIRPIQMEGLRQKERSNVTVPIQSSNMPDALWLNCSNNPTKCCQGKSYCTSEYRIKNLVTRNMPFIHGANNVGSYTKMSHSEILARADLCPGRENAKVSYYALTHSPEKSVAGTRGSGAVYFAGCDMKCDFCIVDHISIGGQGKILSSRDLATALLQLQSQGAHNIALFSPTLQMRPFLRALAIAKEEGLTLPIVYKTGGYDSLALIEALNGIVDIYIPDLKYSDSTLARKYSHVSNYVSRNRAAIKEMHRQVGDLALNSDGLAQRGLIARVLLMPNSIEGVDETARFLAEDVGTNTYVHLMASYMPHYKALNIPELNAKPTDPEVRSAYEMMVSLGFHRFEQHYSANSESWIRTPFP